ncbi:MAG: 3-oxoacyl-[acyl-carrier-protein] reductase FabG [Deltaproteobacteria bacterium]|jgi:3-oxoacyl-[acyl-carrier protein] reductase|nr:3-oxoacyl-[acyl-carrier-protein] reductase FabG [Deltaproteobacteria bacterium]
MELKDKVVVITGAAQGLGRQFALDCAGNGMKVALADINPEALEKTRKECEDKGIEARGYELNVTDESQVEAVYSQVVSDFGTLDATVNNAGILRDSLLVKVKDGEIRKFPLSKWQEVIDTNLTGVFLCGREGAAQFLAQKKTGVIVNIASVARSGNFGQSNYSAAKAGVSAMTVLWAQELAQHGIRVAGVAPGFTATEMVVSLRDDIKEKFVKSIPLRRFAEPTEMSDGVLFILRNDYFTGRMLEIDGGARI